MTLKPFREVLSWNPFLAYSGFYIGSDYELLFNERVELRQCESGVTKTAQWFHDNIRRTGTVPAGSPAHAHSTVLGDLAEQELPAALSPGVRIAALIMAGFPVRRVETANESWQHYVIAGVRKADVLLLLDKAKTAAGEGESCEDAPGADSALEASITKNKDRWAPVLDRLGGKHHA